MQKVAVVMGGYSDECVISLRSGQLILNNLDPSKYEIFEIHILKEGWYCLQNGEKRIHRSLTVIFSLNM